MTKTTWNLDPARLEDTLTGFRDRRVVVLGDVMLDRYLWGAVSRISPEAPVPIVEVDRETVRLGGAANVAANLQALGAEPVLIGLVGDDRGAVELREAMSEHGISDASLVVDRKRPTTRKTRVVAHNQQVVRVDQERADDVGGEVIARLVDELERVLDDVGALVISDYGKGVVTRTLLGEVLDRCAVADLPVCVDPKESHFDAYRRVSVITPNLLEAGGAMGRRIVDDTVLEEVGFGLLERLESPAVLITRSERGMSLFERGGLHTHFPAVAQEVYDVTGAGDTVVGTYALALAAGADHKLAAAIANHAAGLVVREVGTATATVAEIRDSFAAAGELSARVDTSAAEPGR
jgi:D-beta-D-heptose 7-phosphate kinase/D-beta-D-heptose 1-phosphate adenosyltransferase